MFFFPFINIFCTKFEDENLSSRKFVQHPNSLLQVVLQHLSLVLHFGKLRWFHVAKFVLLVVFIVLLITVENKRSDCICSLEK